MGNACACMVPKRLTDLSGDASDVGGLLESSYDPLRIGCVVDCYETFSTANCSVATDRTVYSCGRQSLKIDVNSGATATIHNALTVTINVRGGIGVLVRIEDLTKLGTATIYLSEDNGTNGYKSTFYNCVTSPVNAYRLVDTEWALVWIAQDAMSSFGSPTGWADGVGPDTYAVAHVKLELIASGGQTPTVYFGGVFHQDIGHAIVMIDADDGISNINTMLQILDVEYRGQFKCNLPIIGSLIDETGNMTTAQLQAAYDNGHCLINHGWESIYTGGGTKTIDEVMQDIDRGQHYLENNGWFRGSKYFAAPGMFTNCTNGDVCADLSTTHRLSRGAVIRDGTYPSFVENYVQLPFSYDPWNLPYRSFYHENYTSGLALVTKANRRHGLVILYMHGVIDLPGYGSPYAAEFRILMDLIKSYVDAGTMEVWTYDQLYARIWGRMLNRVSPRLMR